MVKRIREDINFDAYDLMDIWRLAYRIGYIAGYDDCEDEAECKPSNDSIPEFISKLLEEEGKD
ncbi:MAG TPA: hypothetical protein OIL83_04675 [Veillonellaceae bacterium]|nr:hypothetical protein [Veillonellaceae bacterium]